MVDVIRGFAEGDGAFHAAEESALYNFRDGQAHLAEEIGLGVYEVSSLTSRRALGLVGDDVGEDFKDLDPMVNPDWELR